MMSGYLRLIVMKTLANRSLSGYDLIKTIEKETGSWKPSFGSIYPLLEKLLHEKLVKVKIVGRKKVYSLIAAGKSQLRVISKSHSIVGVNLMFEVLSSLKKGQLPFNEISPELNEFKVSLFNAYSRGKERSKLKSILRSATTKIRSIK